MVEFIVSQKANVTVNSWKNLMCELLERIIRKSRGKKNIASLIA